MKIHQPADLIEDANEALQMLKDGNERFLNGEPILKTCCSADREVYISGQKPFAAIITCSDSRVVPEIFFDQKLGDIYTIRNAGNIVDRTTLGSLEYAIQHLRTRLIVVCGHNKCGAVTGACSGEEFTPNINHIMEYIKPAVKNGGSIDEISRKNVEIQVELIRADEALKNLEVLVAGAFFDISSGKVTWLNC